MICDYEQLAALANASGAGERTWIRDSVFSSIGRGYFSFANYQLNLQAIST
jgi:hypothetical protein